VILLTAYADVPTAVAAMKGGAQEFFTFPDDLERMVERVRAIIAAQSGAERDWLEERVVGKSAAMRRVRERIRAVAPLRVPVLVIGEQGSGRDSVVEAVQAASEHNDAPLARFPSGTGGQPKLPTKPSVYYLDQVEKLTPLEQAYWFDLLREGIPRANPPILRVLASSGSDLGVQIREAGFHRRLADQLLRFTIGLVPLRDRIDDIAQLAPLLANRVGRRIGREEIRLDRGALTLLKAQQWQDNVRELESVVEKLVAFSSTGVITRDHVQQILGESPDNVSSLRSRRSEKQREELIELLEACGGNLAEVARRLEISRGAVIYRAQKYGLMPRPR
jgi:DNA-binding NtrC family response regulator